MKKYVVLASGVNCHVEVEGVVQRCSFQTTRCLEAEDVEAARQEVRHLIAHELEDVLHNHDHDPILLTVDWLTEVASFEDYKDLPYNGEYCWTREY